MNAEGPRFPPKNMRILPGDAATKTWPGTKMFLVGLLLIAVYFCLVILGRDGNETSLVHKVGFVGSLVGLGLMPTGIAVNGVWAVTVRKYTLKNTLLWFLIGLAGRFLMENANGILNVSSLVLIYAGAGLMAHLLVWFRNRKRSIPDSPAI